MLLGCGSAALCLSVRGMRRSSILLSAHLLLYWNDSHHNPLTLLAIQRLYRRSKTSLTEVQSTQRGGAATKRIGTQGNSQAGKQETQENRIIGKVQRSGPRPDPLFSPRTQRAQRSLRSAQNFLANLALFARGVLRIRVHGRFQTETSRMTLNTGRVNIKPKNELRRKMYIKKTKWTDSSTEDSSVSL